MKNELNTIPLKVKTKQFANSSVLSVDIPEEICKKHGILKGELATFMIKENEDSICIMYKFDRII